MRRLTTIEDENSRLKKIVADLTLDWEMLQDVIRRNGWFAPPVQGSPDDVQDCIDVSGLSRVSWISSKAMMRSARAVPNQLVRARSPLLERIYGASIILSVIISALAFRSG